MSGVTTTPPPEDDGDFFDDDNNKAMFLVLPAMIFIYGSCCLIYCVHKCRRYCAVQKKKKIKAEKMRRKIEEGQGFHNTALILHDELLPGMSRGIRGPRHPIAALTLEPMNSDGVKDGDKGAKAMIRPPADHLQETDVDELEDVLQTERLEAVAPAPPGYAGNLSQEMQHLDNQLKVAFRLVDTGAVAKEEVQQTPVTQISDAKMDSVSEMTSSVPTDEALATYTAWKALQRTNFPKLSLRTTPAGDTVVERIPKKQRMVMVTNSIDMPEEDLRAIADVRKTIAKDMPKSMPDIFKKADENAGTLKKMNAFSKRRIFLSHQ